jgi:SAM-dependent methyltransferase
MTCSSEFWNALAPHHSRIENSYLDLPSIRRILHEIHPPVLIVGAGQGLIVAELQKKGLQCDGVDLSSEMIKYAKTRRGIKLVQANATAMPFGNETYRTIIYATGVIDFMSDKQEIRTILAEARRIAHRSANIFVAFYKMSPATEGLLVRVGLLRNNVLCHRQIFEIYRLKPHQAIAWVAARANVGYVHAAILSLRSWIFSTLQEKRNGFHMQRLFAKANHADKLIQTAPEELAYRNEAEIRSLFTRLAIPIKQLETFSSCYIAKI